MDKILQNAIVRAAIPSRSLRSAIKDYRFPEKDLLALTAQYVRNLAARLSFYEKISQSADDRKIRRWALQLKVFEEGQWNELSTVKPGEFYVVFPEDEHKGSFFCCDSLENALVNVRRWYRHYQCTSEYGSAGFKTGSVYKTSAVPCVDLDEWCTPNASVNASGIVDIYTKVDSEWGNRSNKESLLHSYNYPLFFPPFLKRGDLVKYISNNYDDCGTEKYGIMAFDMPTERGEDYDVSCIEELEQDYVALRRCDARDENGYFLCMGNHCHVPYPYVEKVSPSDVPQNVREDYEYYLEFLQRELFQKQD